MLATHTINRTRLARQTRQVMEQARGGRPVFVASRGEEQVAIVDALDYRLLKAAATYNTLPPHAAPVYDAQITPRGLKEDETGGPATNTDPQLRWTRVLVAYFDGDISLGRAGQLLGLSRFELQERLNRLGLPLRLGAMTLREAQAEYDSIVS
jgi:hypothetical protein